MDNTELKEYIYLIDCRIKEHLSEIRYLEKLKDNEIKRWVKEG